MKRRNFLAMIPFVAAMASCENPFKPKSKPPPIERYKPPTEAKRKLTAPVLHHMT
jgi:hypothetical protein